MTLDDPIFGTFEITEQVIVDLLRDPTVQRAARIMQGGPYVPIMGWKDFSRLDHCIGTMLLVRHLGGSIEEQIAALLHDISHTAFSHVVDFVFSHSQTQNYHELIKDTLVSQSAIPEILSRYGFSSDYICDDANFTLLERPSPALCADRLDYALRAYVYYGGDRARAYALFNSLTVCDNEIFFKSVESAIDFAYLFLDFSHHTMAGVLNMASYHILADVLRHALDTHLLTEQELLLSDDEVLSKVSLSTDPYISSRLALLSPGLIARSVKDSDMYHYRVITKKRWVRPQAYVEKNLIDSFVVDKRLSEKYREYFSWVEHPFYIYVEGLSV
jgi:HD superfamily phosphohydrolase